MLQTPTGMVLFVLTYALAEACLLPALPGTVLAGTLYGPWLGSFLVFIGAGTGAMAVFTISRHWLRSHAERWIKRSRHLESLQRAVNEEGLRMLMVARLSPLLPFNLLNVAYGLSDIHPLTFAVGLLGILPATMIYVSLGATLLSSSGLSLVGAVASLAVAILLFRRLRG